jgi:hypothetical protein
MRRSLAVCAALSVSATLIGASATTATAKTVWLCKPGIARDACKTSLRTTLFSPSGKKLGVKKVRRARHPKIDCFYVYPTVSNQTTLQATLAIDPELRSIALYQAARYSRDCRVFAPVYRQITLAGLANPDVTPAMRATAYNDVRSAWRDYVKHYNKGRGVVLVSHSQGTFVLRQLVAEEIDPKPAVRKRIVSAILLGGDVEVKEGRPAGGDFKHVKACRSAKQLGCVIAFSTFNGPVPAGSFFGSTDVEGREVLCTNPASLGGGAGKINSVYPTKPFARGVIGSLIPAVGTLPTAPTPWIEVRGAYRARCSSAGGANVLQISSVDGAPKLHPIPDESWGLHLTDGNIALGTLTDLVRAQAARYVRKRG